MKEQYLKANRTVLSLILAVNLAVFGYQIHSWPIAVFIVNGLWIVLVVWAIFAESNRASTLALASLILLYIYMFFAQVLERWLL